MASISNSLLFRLNFEWVDDCCLTPIQQFFSKIMVRTSYFSMRWWWGPLCARPTRLIAHWKNMYNLWIDMSLHSDTSYRFRANPSFLLIHECSMVSGKAVNTNSKVFWFGLSETRTNTRGKHTNHYYTNDAVCSTLKIKQDD